MQQSLLTTVCIVMLSGGLIGLAFGVGSLEKELKNHRHAEPDHLHECTIIKPPLKITNPKKPTLYYQKPNLAPIER